MAIAKVSVQSARTSGGDPTVSVNVTTGNILVAIFSSQDSNRSNLGAGSVTRNGQSFTKIYEKGGSPTNTGGPPCNIQIWVLINPNSGTSNAVADGNTFINECTLTVWELSGVDTADYNEGNDGDEGNGSAPAMSVVTANDTCFLIGGICSEANISSVGTGQTSDAHLTDQGFENTRCSSEVGGAAGAQAHSYGMGFGTAYAQVMMAINPSVVAAAEYPGRGIGRGVGRGINSN